MRRYFYVNDRKYVVRFFDADSATDLADLVAIVKSPGAQRWMDNVSDFSVHGFRTWMSEKGRENSFLFAVAEMENAGLEGRVHGFVYVYPRKGERNTLEISYARRPDGVAGLMADGLHLTITMVREYLSMNRSWEADDLKFVAEIERGNWPSIKVAQKAGFVQKTGFDREGNALWIMTAEGRPAWRGLPSEPKKLARARQKTGSYCGPAVLQILASHFGVPLDQEEIAEAAGVKEKIALRGMSHAQMATAVGTLMRGYSFWWKMPSSIDEIEKMVRVFNYPVGVNWQGIFEQKEYPDDLSWEQKASYVDEPMCRGEEGHYSVVIDLDRASNYVRMMDPYGHYSEADRYIRLEEFEERWWDDRMDYFEDGTKKYFYADKLMFAIVPKGVRLPEEIRMREI